MNFDLINGLFELIGAFCIWLNVRRLWIDREIKGIDWRVTLFFWTWGVWNLWYYPSLDQWFSAIAGALLALGNTAWIALTIWFKWGHQWLSSTSVSSFPSAKEFLLTISPKPNA